MSYTAQHVYDALPSSHDARDYRVEAPAQDIPDHAMLPAVPILDQGAEGACVGHGCAGARETTELITNGAAPVVPLSRAFIYWEARNLEGTQNEDAGAEVRDGCKVMKEIGVCTEDQFPYHAGDFASIPPDVDVKAASQYQIAAYIRLADSQQMRGALAAGRPVIIGISVYQSFEQEVASDGVVPMPDKVREQLLGGHCLYVRGYYPDPNRPGHFLFVVPNSWGTGWADHGVCYISDAYFDDPELCSDMWVIQV